MASFLPNPVAAFATAYGLNKAQPSLLPKLSKEQGVDFAQKAAMIQRALEEARALKLKAMQEQKAGEMVSGHYVPNYAGMIGNAAAGLIGQSREKDLMQQAQEAAAAQQAAQQEWMGKLPTGQAAIPEQAMGPGLPVEMGGGEGVVEGPAPMQPGQAAKPPTQQEIAAWAAEGAGINPQLAGAVQTKLVNEQLEALFPKQQGFMQVAGGVFDPKTGKFHISPEHTAEAEAKREDRRQMLEIRAAQLDWQRENANLNREQKAELARQAAELRLQLKALGSAASGGAGTLVKTGEVDENGNPVYINNKTGEERTRTGEPVGATMPSTSFEKATAEAAGAAASLKETSDLLSRAKTLPPDTFGRGSAVVGKLPRIIGAPVETAMMTPEQRQFRADAIRYGAKERHALYGAALTAPESELANKFIINADDDMPTVRDKLAGIQRVQKMVNDRLSQTGAGRAASKRAQPASGGWGKATVQE